MEKRRSGALHAGASFGIVGALLGFCSIAAVTLARLLGGPFGFVALFGCVAGLGALAALVWVGIAPARASGRAAAGAGAGALAGAFTGAGLLIGLLVDGTQNSTIPTPATAGDALGYGIGVLILIFGSAALFACLGAGLGALGGLIGRDQAQRRDLQPPIYPPAGMPPYAAGTPYPTYPTYPTYPPPYPPPPADHGR